MNEWGNMPIPQTLPLVGLWGGYASRSNRITAPAKKLISYLDTREQLCLVFKTNLLPSAYYWTSVAPRTFMNFLGGTWLCTA